MGRLEKCCLLGNRSPRESVLVQGLCSRLSRGTGLCKGLEAEAWHQASIHLSHQDLQTWGCQGPTRQGSRQPECRQGLCLEAATKEERGRSLPPSCETEWGSRRKEKQQFHRSEATAAPPPPQQLQEGKGTGMRQVEKKGVIFSFILYRYTELKS